MPFENCLTLYYNDYNYLALPLLMLSLTVCLICYPDRCIGTKARPDLPGPLGLPLIGNLIQLIPHRKRMLRHLGWLQSQYGELFTFTMPGWGRNIVINRPEWLEHVRRRDAIGYGKGHIVLSIFREFPGAHSAFGTEGAEWKLSRRIMHPIFATKNFDRKVSHAMDSILPVAHKLLTAAAESGIEFDFNQLCGRLALVIFCKMAMGLDTSILTADPMCLNQSDKMMDAVMILNRISSGRLYNPLWAFTEYFDGDRQAFDHAREDIFCIIADIVQKRQKLGETPKSHSEESEHDFLSTLLSDSSITKPALLRDTLVTLLFAGRDNTQNVLGWSLYELSRNPQWINQMRYESANRNEDGVVRYSDLSQYPIHLAVFYETLRLWPGVPKNARLALQDDELPEIPDEGVGSIPISKGDYVLWSDFDMMRNPKVWGSNAGLFDPGRHLTTEGKFVKPSQPKFHAFGAGPRLCPGAQLAAYEFVAIWVKLLPDFDFTPIEMKERNPSDALTMSMDGPFMITVQKRPA